MLEAKIGDTNNNIIKINHNTTNGVYTINGEVCDKKRVDNFSGMVEWKIDGITQYEGDITNGKYNGQGKYHCKDGTTYEGNWTNNKIEGETTCCTPSGKKYICTIKGDILNGEAQLYQNGKLWYDGNFKDGLCENGTLYYEDGEIQYSGNFENFFFSGPGKYYDIQGIFDGISNNDELISGSYYLNKDHDHKPIYTIATNENDKTKEIKYFLEGKKENDQEPDVTLVIDQNNVQHWTGTIAEKTKQKAKMLFCSFDETENKGYNIPLTNLVSINNNSEVIHFNNSVDFTSKTYSFNEQLQKFNDFIKDFIKNSQKDSQKGIKQNTQQDIQNKVIISELYTEDHAVGIIYKNGYTVIIDTSGGIYSNKSIIDDLKDKNITILSQDIQSIGNCTLASRLVTNELAQSIADEQIDIKALVSYGNKFPNIPPESHYANEHQSNTFNELDDVISKSNKDGLRVQLNRIKHEYEELYNIKQKLKEICEKNENKCLYVNKCYLDMLELVDGELDTELNIKLKKVNNAIKSTNSIEP